MTKLSEAGMLKPNTDQKLDLLCQTAKLWMQRKKLLKKTKSATPEKTWMIRKQNSHVDNMKKDLMAWREEETRHNIPLSQSLIQSQALTLFNCVKAERDEKFAKTKG